MCEDLGSRYVTQQVLWGVAIVSTILQTGAGPVLTCPGGK